MTGTIEVIITIGTIVGMVWGIYTHWNVVWEMLRYLGKLWDKFYSTSDIPRRYLARRINSEEFLAWQDHVLLKIYGEKYFSKTLQKQFPVFCIDVNPDNSDAEQVDSLCRNDKGEPLLNSSKYYITLPDIYDTEIMTHCVAKESPEKDAELSYKKKLMGNGWWWKGYKWFTARSMRDGNHIGFVLDHLELDDNKKIKKIHLAVGDYKLNLLTSHILTYEMYKAYEKLQKEGQDPNNVTLETLWPMLPFRHYIHHVNGDDVSGSDRNIDNVLFSGMGRYALLSVQCLVMLCTDVHNNIPEYKTFLLKRSDSTRDVSTKLGCFQFPPSGGFDLYDKENFRDMDTIKDNCSLYLALMREYFEEIFNDRSFAKADKTNALGAFDRIRKDERARKIEEMFENELDERSRARAGFKPGTKQAYFTTVGANIDLIDLRLSVNFLLVVNDIQYVKDNAEKFTPNEEYGWRLCKKKKRMLRSWDYVEEKLNGRRKIVEDSVALYIQGKKAFEKYINSIRTEKI